VEHFLTNVGGNIGTVAAILLAGYVLFRSRTPALLKDELSITRARCKRLEEDNTSLKSSDHAKDVMIADLKAKTDLNTITTQIVALQQQIAQESAETKVTIVGMIQSVSKDIMTGFAQHAEEDHEFQQRLSDNFAQVSLILDGIERRIPLSDSTAHPTQFGSGLKT